MPTVQRNRARELLTKNSVSGAWAILHDDAKKSGISPSQIDAYLPTMTMLTNIKRDAVEAYKQFAQLEGVRIMNEFPREQGVFVVDMSFFHQGEPEIFIVPATDESLRMLVEHGQNIFFMDGMHGVNAYANNQMVTINVRVGKKGFSDAYLITCRYVSTIILFHNVNSIVTL